MSGAYTAWRLKQDNPALNVVLYEYSDRIGGRDGLCLAPCEGQTEGSARATKNPWLVPT